MSLSGYADLPLHSGHVPRWLAELMKSLAKGIIKVLIMEFGNEGLLRRLSNPLWFQAFNNVIGMDWDSSGSTTVTTAIIKYVLDELGLDVRIAGGKGRTSLNVPQEISKYVEELGGSTLTINELVKCSKLTAKVDSILLQDGFTLYHHAIAFDVNGRWVVIQQGMNPERKLARRYHIAWFAVNTIDEEPHSGISSDYVGEALNLTDRNSRNCKKVILDLVCENPKKITTMVFEVNRILKNVKSLYSYIEPSKTDRTSRPAAFSNIPYYRPVKVDNALIAKLMKAYEVRPSNMEEMLLIPGLGGEVIRALSLISELIYREPPSLKDPVTHPYDPFKYAFAIGGKDGVPFPVKRELVVSVIKELGEIIKDAELGSRERLIALRALSKLAPKELVPNV
ncbi:MAG: DUF763 domain-containing protein [Sulfolobales archaeon]